MEVDSEEAGVTFEGTVLLVVFKQDSALPSTWKCSYFWKLIGFKVILSYKIFKCTNTDVPIPSLENTTFPNMCPDFGISDLPGMKIQSSLKCCYSYNCVLSCYLPSRSRRWESFYMLPRKVGFHTLPYIAY